MQRWQRRTLEGGDGEGGTAIRALKSVCVPTQLHFRDSLQSVQVIPASIFPSCLQLEALLIANSPPC